jgi:hypothetical protein
MKIFRRLPILLGMGLLVAAGSIIRAEIIADTLKTAEAVRAKSQIHIDGILNEKAWESAPAITGFRQTQPDEGEPVSESTLVKVLYDDEAVYVGYWCYDREPDKIIKQLTRRDRWTASDQVSVRFDSFHDHQTAYYFNVNAAGVMRDILIYNNNWTDESWDAVWEANARVTGWGWAAEIKIPYSALRFAEADEYVWGVDFRRAITRKNEIARWQFVPRRETDAVSRYGHIAGIRGITPPGRIETLPYLVSYGVTEPKGKGNLDGREYFSNIGVDFKYGLTSSITLDATVNPDFGQVESDRSIVNLSTYEYYYEEKRPFFLEGFEIFDTPFFDQFYSRRIGRKPYRTVDSADHYINYPRNTTILSALKLSGKTRSGTSIGFLNATTDEEKTEYRLENDSNTYEAIVEPLANYSVIRVKQDLLKSSYIGGMFTSVNQKERADAYTGSVDWRIHFLDEKFHFVGITLGSNNGPGTGDMAAATEICKDGGRIIRGNVWLDYYGREVDWNRLGFLNRNSSRGIGSWIQLYSNKQYSMFRHVDLNFNGWYNENLDGYRLSNGGNVNTSVEFVNNWWFWSGAGLDGSKYDDRETRGNGLWFINGNYRMWMGGCTSNAKKIQLELNYSHDNERNGLFYQYSIWSNFRLLTNFEFSLGTSYNLNRKVDFWVGYGEDGLPVFGDLDNDNLDINFKGIYMFSRDFSLQWFTQFYFSTGEYENFRKLADPFTLTPITDENYTIYFRRGDFNYKSLNLNLILRWEYLPGSTLFLVWTHARDGNDDYGNFKFSRDFRDLFDTPQTNTFLVKANYWWNI